jgi:hypothetical protein
MFDEFLEKKKISAKHFKTAEPLLYQQLKDVFEKVSEKSFVQQKLFLINPLRRKYKLEQ